MILLALSFGLLTAPAVQAPQRAALADVCPLVIRVRSDGVFVTYRFSEWRVTSPRTLDSDLKAGCYNDNNPSKVTSVTVQASKAAPAPRLKRLFDLLEANGWPHDRVQIR